jgi:thymidylate synthase (FAD)
MNAIGATATIIDVDFGKNVLKKIELVGRTCYKSEDKITDDSAEKFVSNLIKSGHEAMLEHASFCFEVDQMLYKRTQDVINWLEEMNFTSFLRFTHDGRYIISGNVRAWRSFFAAVIKLLEKLPYVFKSFIKDYPVLFPEFQKVKFNGKTKDSFMKPLSICDLKTENEFLTHCDITVKFIVDRGVSHELVRHRVASFAQESTRYCNYGKDKFGGQLTFIIPLYLDYKSAGWNVWKETMEKCEKSYFDLLNIGLTPQEARAVLPNSIKTELMMTANAAEWIHFFELRACNKTGKAHPQMLEVTRPLLDEFKETITIIFDGLTYGE